VEKENAEFVWGCFWLYSTAHAQKLLYSWTSDQNSDSAPWFPKTEQ